MIVLFLCLPFQRHHAFHSECQCTRVDSGLFQQGDRPGTVGNWFHCLELITNVIRNERQWRCATGREGLRMTTNPLKLFFTDPRCLVLFFAKPLLHSMFGLSLVLNFGGSRETISELWMYTCIAQIWNLCIMLIIFACFFTFIASR
ncbi:hypothetical protein F4604DRAFT_1037665 [Suillus subluteus]|nr:hypothetical protein F4604DRAFT_1037665 [Suillus subluteus]